MKSLFSKYHFGGNSDDHSDWIVQATVIFSIITGVVAAVGVFVYIVFIKEYGNDLLQRFLLGIVFGGLSGACGFVIGSKIIIGLKGAVFGVCVGAVAGALFDGLPGVYPGIIGGAIVGAVFAIVKYKLDIELV